MTAADGDIGPPSREPLAWRDSITNWYQPSHGQSVSRDIAHEAYTDAIKYLKREMRGSDEFLELLKCKTTIQELKDVVDQARSRYDSLSKETSARYWLRVFSARIMYYGQVLDVLSQHHPEYVSLAWGSIKFVLTGILNHEKLVSQLSQALSKIGEALRQTKLSAELYQTAAMKEAISRLYAHIILFSQQAVKWYNMGSAGRAISSIFKPFDLDYKDTVEEIKLCSQTINDIASAAGRAELRDIHITIQMQHKQLQERYEKLHEMQVVQKEIQERIDNSTCRVLQIATSHKAITESVHSEVLNINPRIYDMQFSSILKVLKPKQCPKEVLEKAYSLAKRVNIASMTARDSANLLDSLGAWISKEGSSLFVVKVGPRAEAKAKEFAADVIKKLQPLSCSVIWSLSWVRSHGSVPSMADMIKSLIFQALSHDPALLYKHPEELNVTKFQSDHSEREWISLITHLFARLSKCFIIIEAEDIFQLHREQPEWAQRFLEFFQSLVDQADSTGNLLKILVVGYGTSMSTLQSVPSKRNRIVSAVQRPMLVPPHMRRRLGSNRRNAAAWQQLRPKF